MNKCKICGGALRQFALFNNTPEKVQYLPNDFETAITTSGISLPICECINCGTVQIPINPVNYYNTAIRSKNWDINPFRKKQKINFINEFNLFGKNIKNIIHEPRVGEHYDAFVMFNYLEHFPSPRHTLQQICENLDSGAPGIVEVPNFDAVIKESAFSEFIHDHLFYFTKKTLRLICEISGFDVIRIEEVLNGASLSATIQKREYLTGIPFYNKKNELINNINQFINMNNSIAIWGASHQTLMILPMLNNINKIKYIIDDFDKKQGKYTPITGKKIYSSKRLLEKPVDAIIVICGHAQNENVIRKIINMQSSYYNDNNSEKNLLNNIAVIEHAKLKII